ncbi:MAG TPA: DNA-binding protein [Armatimonadetes bacterium]|nr:DNA-binding protein [Armatimonadota bacterium]
MEIGKMLKLSEVAEILRVSRQTVLRLIKTGQIRAIKVGRQWRVPEEALKTLINPEGSKSGEGKGKRSE